MHARPALLLALALLTSAAVRAADPDPALLSAFAANRHAIRLQNGRLEGDGAKLLLDEAAKSQFFLLGEDHGAAETAQVGEAMAVALQPLGFRHIAIEAGPLTGQRLERLAREGGAPALAKFAAAYPFALPFFGWAEEQAYLAAAVRAYGPSAKRVVWGLDQEFVFSPGFHLERLGQLAKTPAAREAVRAMQERSERGARELTATHDPSTVLMMKATPADFDALAAELPKGGEAARIIGELKESAAIYQMWLHRQGYESNLTRSLLMKRHFVANYDEAIRAGEAKPRVLLKFGLNHLMRGRTYVDVFDLGTFLPELAARNGMQAFHVAILARSGGGSRAALRPARQPQLRVRRRAVPRRGRRGSVDAARSAAAAEAARDEGGDDRRRRRAADLGLRRRDHHPGCARGADRGVITSRRRYRVRRGRRRSPACDASAPRR
jgi:hypothetical protein